MFFNIVLQMSSSHFTMVSQLTCNSRAFPIELINHDYSNHSCAVGHTCLHFKNFFKAGKTIVEMTCDSLKP